MSSTPATGGNLTGDPATTLLVRVTGIDRPGITAGILHILDTSRAEVLDMEQVVVRDHLNLGLLIEIQEGRSPLKDLLFFGWQRDVHIDFEVVTPPGDAPLPPRFAVTVIGATLPPAALAVVADAIAEADGNIERIARLSKYPVISYELVVVGSDLDALRSNLLQASHDHLVDVAIQAEGLARRAKRLVVIDLDSTLIQDEVIDLLADAAGKGAEVRKLTAAAMAGELDFETSLRQRVALLGGTPVSALDAAADAVTLTPGARTFVRTLKRLGFTTAVVSGGFQFFADRAKSTFGLDYAYANQLETSNGTITGRLRDRIIDGPAKAQIMAEVADAAGVDLAQTVAVGDGANDLEMLSAAGLGIAFNAKPAAAAAADTSVTVPYLDALLFVLGVRREDIEEADRMDDALNGSPSL